MSANTDLATFLAHSVALEEEARERYEELADIMETHHNRPVADFFRRMTEEASHHLAEVAELAEGMELPRRAIWELDWPDSEPPETASYEAVHYRMSLRQAMALALEQERAAQAYYRQYAADSEDAETVRAATRFADEETEHAAALERMIAELPENGANLRIEDDEPNMPE